MLAAQTRVHAERERVVEIEERGQQHFTLAGVFEDPAEGLAHLLLGRSQRGDAGGREHDPDRPAVSGNGLTRNECPIDQAVDDRGDRGLRDGQAFGQQGCAFVAARYEREHPELREREVACGRGPLEGAGRERQGPGGSGEVGGMFAHARQGTEPLESRTIYAGQEGAPLRVDSTLGSPPVAALSSPSR